jgi:hypothetical protein
MQIQPPCIVWGLRACSWHNSLTPKIFNFFGINFNHLSYLKYKNLNITYLLHNVLNIYFKIFWLKWIYPIHFRFQHYRFYFHLTKYYKNKNRIDIFPTLPSILYKRVMAHLFRKWQAAGQQSKLLLQSVDLEGGKIFAGAAKIRNDHSRPEGSLHGHIWSRAV